MASPETCLHRIYAYVPVSYLTAFAICISCDSELSPEYREGRTYKYDPDTNVYVEIVGKRKPISIAQQLIRAWESDPEVPSYVIDQFKRNYGNS